MQPNDIAHLNQDLQAYYGDRYAGMTGPMFELWYDKLKGFPVQLGHQAIKRFAADHPLHVIPSLNQLAEVMEDLQREQRRAATSRSPALQWDASVLAQENRLQRDQLRALIEQAVPGTFPTRSKQSDEERQHRREHLRAQLDAIMEEQDAVSLPWGRNEEA